MNPQIPLALRMSGHLLLGVVRIYSKKVEYLQHDYNMLRIKISRAFAYPNINLPEDATQATFESITLPDKFDLDLMDIDDYSPYRPPNGIPNKDVSFTDHPADSFSNDGSQTPTGYIRFSHNPSISADNSEPGSIAVDKTSDLRNTPPTTDGVQIPGPKYQIGSNDSFTTNDNIVGSREILVRPALSDRIEPDDELAKLISKERNKAPSTVDEKAADFELLSVDEEVLVESSSQPKQNPQPDLDNYEPGHAQDVAYEIKPSPKRSVIYDEATILTNEFMKKCIDDASGLSRKRKGACSLLDAWKLNNAHKKGKFLFDPLITGMCNDLCQMFKDGYVSTKPHLMNDTREANNDNMKNSSPNDIVDSSGNNNTNSPDNRPPSPPPTDKNTTVMSTDVGSKPCQVQTTEGTGEGYEDTEYPSQSHQDFENGGSQPDTLEVDDIRGLSFIEDDQGTSISSRGTSNVDYSCGQLPETGSLLERTRAVAQYIKEKSAATPSTSENAGSVSMKSILVGKTRTVCSRLFFEILVLKSCDLVDVKQDEPYGDITLIVTPTLSKLQFLS